MDSNSISTSLEQVKSNAKNSLKNILNKVPGLSITDSQLDAIVEQISIDEAYKMYNSFYDIFNKVKNLELSNAILNNYITQASDGFDDYNNVPTLISEKLEEFIDTIPFGFDYDFSDSDGNPQISNIHPSSTIFKMPILFSTVNNDELDVEIYSLIK